MSRRSKQGETRFPLISHLHSHKLAERLMWHRRYLAPVFPPLHTRFVAKTRQELSEGTVWYRDRGSLDSVSTSELIVLEVRRNRIWDSGIEERKFRPEVPEHWNSRVLAGTYLAAPVGVGCSFLCSRQSTGGDCPRFLKSPAHLFLSHRSSAWVFPGKSMV